MSRTPIPTKRVTTGGVTWVAADLVAGDVANGNYAANDGATYVYLVADGSVRTCTVTTPTTAGVPPLAIADEVITVPASGFALAGPFPRELYGPQLLLDFSNTALKALVFSWLPEVRF